MSREDMNSVFSEAIEMASYFLIKNEEFFPFAIGMDSIGGIQHIQGWTGEDPPPSDDVRQVIIKGPRGYATSGEFRCTGIVTDIRITIENTKTDAIRVEIEHKDESPVTCFVPYTLNAGNIVTGEIVAEAGKKQVFVHNSNDT